METLSQEEREALQVQIQRWRAKAASTGSMHSLWDVITDAESLIEGKPTIIGGNPREVFENLIKYSLAEG